MSCPALLSRMRRQRGGVLREKEGSLDVEVENRTLRCLRRGSMLDIVRSVPDLFDDKRSSSGVAKSRRSDWGVVDPSNDGSQVRRRWV